jgi:hypothetical protein
MGDSTAYGLDLFFPQDSLPQMRRAGTYQLGCGFSRLAYRYEERVADVQHCQGWEQRTRDHVALHRPDATVIQSHAWVLFDRSVDGVDHPPGSAVFASDFVDSLRTAVAVGGSDGSVPVFIVKIGCLAPVFHEEILGDPARTRIVNALIDEVAASMPNTHVVESSDVTCRDGRAVERSGSNPRYRDDGMHWTRTGAEVMWNRIAWAMDRARAEGS